MYIKEHARCFSARKYTYSKGNFMENQLRPYKIFAKCIRYSLRMCRMNEKVHHFSIRLHVSGRTTPALLPSFTFVAFSRFFLQARFEVEQWAKESGSLELYISGKRFCETKNKRIRWRRPPTLSFFSIFLFLSSRYKYIGTYLNTLLLLLYTIRWNWARAR